MKLDIDQITKKVHLRVKKEYGYKFNTHEVACDIRALVVRILHQQSSFAFGILFFNRDTDIATFEAETLIIEVAFKTYVKQHKPHKPRRRKPRGTNVMEKTQ